MITADWWCLSADSGTLQLVCPGERAHSSPPCPRIRQHRQLTCSAKMCSTSCLICSTSKWILPKTTKQGEKKGHSEIFIYAHILDICALVFTLGIFFFFYVEIINHVSFFAWLPSHLQQLSSHFSFSFFLDLNLSMFMPLCKTCLWTQQRYFQPVGKRWT